MKLEPARAGKGAALYAAALLLCVGSLNAQFLPTTPLPQALLSHTVVTMAGRIYVAGGISNSGGIYGRGGYLNNVYYSAQMNPDGTLGAWQVASPMPEMLGLGLHASLAHNGKLYVLGGTNLFGPRDVAYYSTANGDGSLSPWIPTTPMPAKLMGHSAASDGKRIYVTGGIVRNIGSHAAVYSAPFNADGTLGAWRAETSLPARLFSHRSMVRNGRLMIFGGSADHTLYPSGQPAGAISAKVLSAAINPDGALGAWQELAPLPVPMMLHAAAATSNSVYVFGGFNGGVSNAVYFAPFLADGTLGAWQALHALPRNLLSLAALATEDYVYTLGGGLAYIDQPQADIFYAKIKAEPKAFVKLDPQTINKSARGKWVTAYFGLPEADINLLRPGTVRITAVNGEAITPIEPDPKFTTKIHTGDMEGMEGVTYAMVKFDRQAVAAVIPEGEFSARIEGRLSDGREFSGESMNRALTSKDRFAYELQEREGERVGPGGVKVRLPKGSFKGNPDLLLTAAPEEEAAVTKTEKEKRGDAMKARGLAAAGRAFEFGPRGMKFNVPVTISLPYDKAAAVPGRALAVGYWNAGKGEWELLSSVVDEENGLVSAETSHFSVYQVMAAEPAAVPVPDSALAFGEVYAFPNPAAGRKPVIHAKVPSGDGMTVRVYTASGRIADTGRVSGAPGQVDDGAGPESAYEYEVREKLQAGVYYFTVEVSKGSQKITKTGKFAVLR
ncbi:MAG: hypothetical protein FD189_1175 [Elusimicrobia bacterium]|nr:MAG: hypothetical protein FD154_1556 [Elusimicrobiota bacterium]KAF0156030.1 MAG: hypothetical protein FD189_1175 [Elusimicrobiota bacterium]